MTIKIKSKIKELMAQKELKIDELREKTGLPHIAILNNGKIVRIVNAGFGVSFDVPL